MFIRWIVIYPVDSAIHRLNNWGQVFKLKDHLSTQFLREIHQLFMKEYSLVITFVSALECDKRKVNNFDWRFLRKNS